MRKREPAPASYGWGGYLLLHIIFIRFTVKIFINFLLGGIVIQNNFYVFGLWELG